MNNKVMALVISLLIAVIVASNTLFIIMETERGVLLKFGKVVNDDLKPGLHIKAPLMHEVRKFDSRVLTLDARPERFLTIEKKGIMVDSFAKWRIEDVGDYYTATNGEESRVVQLLSQRINEGLRNQFAQRSLQEVVSGERDQLMTDLTENLNKLTIQRYGIRLVDVRVKRIDLPEQVSESVFNRMTSEREREAREHRSKGKEQAEVIRADADRQRTILEAEAYRDAELLRGAGDAKAAAIYAQAYTQDPEFYSFVRSLTAYKETFNNKGDMMLVDPKSDFFRYLKSSKGK
ncbi:MAG: protease modulator HflC [Gammaproteobacteria bacterium]|uniref:protease modulator HflC n=1 Tax=Pseudomaricurvus alcaniphilus TaxID=1166482 RepID=UPI00140E7AC5|nr:protease modulator HflC [Pseudomaricurvus alcaniphilus]MBR9909805.1 protease modulator HflC [Gammaproteobacteria bacterium]NHN38531.1 protease modulator HflC [Pseudomaricurvus alcaniphilus]